ncbi:hypothetical protein VNO77_03008 [Canavalia gladiata]|uniref:Uncharacterized protein n=1 Tax=Canavalia gladiata TaxID=3824 RepID=A0AAN9MW15_CANGL
MEVAAKCQPEDLDPLFAKSSCDAPSLQVSPFFSLAIMESQPLIVERSKGGESLLESPTVRDPFKETSPFSLHPSSKG